PRLAVPFLRGAMLHVDDAQGAPVGSKWSDHRFACGRVRAALHLSREEHRPTGLRDRPGDPFTDALPIQLRFVREATRGSHRKLALGVGEHDRDTYGSVFIVELRGRTLEGLIGIALL